MKSISGLRKGSESVKRPEITEVGDKPLLSAQMVKRNLPDPDATETTKVEEQSRQKLNDVATVELSRPHAFAVDTPRREQNENMNEEKAAEGRALQPLEALDPAHKMISDRTPT